MKPRFSGLNELLAEYDATTRDKTKTAGKAPKAPAAVLEDHDVYSEEQMRKIALKEAKRVRYVDKGHFLSEFKQTTRDLDKANPKDPTLAPKATVATAQQMVESVQAPPKRIPRAEAAHMSKYSSPQRAMESFRILAGMDVVEQQPWNPGIVGETRTVSALMEAYGMKEDDDEMAPVQRHQGSKPTTDAGHIMHPPRRDMGGYSPKAAHKALTHSARVTANQHAVHSYMHELPDDVKSAKKAELAQASQHAAHKLRGAADGAPADVSNGLHDLASRHEKHARIYQKGGRPKLESIQAMEDIQNEFGPEELSRLE